MNQRARAILPIALRVATLVAVLAAGPARAQATSADVALQATDIIDSQGFGQPIPAAVLQVPAGWRAQGGVKWERATHCSSNQVRLEWVAASPDGEQSFEIMHGFGWQLLGTQIPMNPCPALPFDTTQAFLRAVVQQRRPGAQVLEYRDRPDLAHAAAQAAQPHPQVRQRHDAGQLFIAYRIGERDFHEILSTAVTFSQVGANVMGGTAMVTAQRAPSGRLDISLGELIAGSIKPNPHWLAMARESVGNAEKRFSSNQRRQIETWHAAEMARINAKGAADRAAIRAQASREVSAINAQTHANTQSTNDRMHRRGLESIGEYNTYRDSAGSQVRSSIHGGDRVLRLPEGNYTSTRDPYYNPPGSEELKQVR